MKDFLAFMQKYFNEGNKDDFYNLYAFMMPPRWSGSFSKPVPKHI